MKKLLLTMLISMLAACSSDTQETSFDNWDIDAIYYSFPHDGQTEVSRHAPITIRFSDPMDFSSANYTLTGPTGNVSIISEIVDENNDGDADNQTLLITPSSPLDWSSQYALTIDNVIGKDGAVNFPDGELNFKTRAAESASKKESIQADEFEMTRLIPDGNDLPIMDFSSLRLQFTHPINKTTARYGLGDKDSISIIDQDNQLVPASLLVNGSYLTIDPLIELDSNRIYSLNINNRFESLYGEDLAVFSKDFVPNDSKPRTTMVQEVLDSESDDKVSLLTGAPINAVPLKSVLVGDKDQSQQSGLIHAELAFAPNYPYASPLRIKRGSVLKGSSLDVKVAGLIPATLDKDGDGTPETAMTTGDLTISYISDAVGYLVPNRYSNAVDAPYHALLYMDVAMTAEETEANSALSQNILHVELNGMAIVKDGLLTIDAIGIVEPEILGLETGYGVLSFNIQGLRDQSNAPAQAVDSTSPVLQSWLPGDYADTVDRDAPIILNFDEPIAPESVNDTLELRLTNNGGTKAIDIDYRVDGSSIIIKPNGGLKPSRYSISSGSKNTNAFQYELIINSGITDLSGNEYAIPPAGTFLFSLNERNRDNDNDLSDGNRHAPNILTTYPGFPCAVANESAIDLTAGTHNECAYRTDWNSDSNIKNHDDDIVYRYTGDTLPVDKMPSNRPIRMRFSQDMEASTFVTVSSPDNSCGSATAGTFKVEKVDSSKNCLNIINGRLETSYRSIAFHPDEPWEDGSFYRYTLSSVVSSPNCGIDSVCSTDDYPVQTAVLLGRDFNQGGPNLVIYFEGDDATSTVYQDLVNLPGADANSDYRLDQFETGLPNATTATKNSAVINVGNGHKPSSGITKVEDVVLGCDFGESCPDKQGVFLTGGLIAEIVGPTLFDDDNNAATPEVDAVSVKLHPTSIIASNLDLSVKILALGFIPITKHSSTGMQIMSLRYQDDDGDGLRDDLIDGYIVSGEHGPEFVTTVNILLGSPQLVNPDGKLRHNQKSLPLTLNLRGPITILPDGRMVIEQLNANTAPLNVNLTVTELGIVTVDLTLDLKIPEDGNYLQYVSTPVKR